MHTYFVERATLSASCISSTFQCLQLVFSYSNAQEILKECVNVHNTENQQSAH